MLVPVYISEAAPPHLRGRLVSVNQLLLTVGILGAYLTNALFTPWDGQFYPDGIRGWMAKVDVGPAGGMALDPRFLVETGDTLRPHQLKLAGGDASSDSFCYAA